MKHDLDVEKFKLAQFLHLVGLLGASFAQELYN